MGRHQQALEHAQSALILLQEELLTPPGVTSEDEEYKPPPADRIAVLAIVYHNCGVEQEFLKRFDQSIMNYKKGFEVAERYLGSKHPICNTLKSSYNAAKKAANQALLKQKAKNPGKLSENTTTDAPMDTSPPAAAKTRKSLNATSPSPSSSSSILPDINNKNPNLASSSPYISFKNSKTEKKRSSSSSALKLKELQATSPYGADPLGVPP